MGVIEKLQKVRTGPGPAEPPMTRSARNRQKFIESIRWEGQIYCQKCGSTLCRVPTMKYPSEVPGYDPFTGRALSDIERYGPCALMVCEKYEESRRRMPPVSSYMWSPPRSFQSFFEDLQRPDHGMYYTDKPPL